MLHLAVLILLTVILYISFKMALDKSFAKKRNDYDSLKNRYVSLAQENIRLITDNAGLERTVRETIDLYDITKDICKTLEEDNIFSIFRSRINRYIEVGDCSFLKAGTDISEYKDYTVLPLMMRKKNIGYLVARDIKGTDLDKFHILAQQFLLGIKRAFLYKRLQEFTITDSLTQAFNRRYFLERFNEELERSKNFKYSFSFLMMDIDHFKDYNDRYGHLVGDAILKAVARTIRDNIRQIDFMGRYGGEEFSVILTETDKEKALFVAERIRQAVEAKNIRAYDEELKVTISIGISTFPADAADSRLLIDRADWALYQAKHKGRNRVCIYKIESPKA